MKIIKNISGNYTAGIAAVIIFIVLILGSRFYVSIPAGHVAVATLFGKVQDQPRKEGLHIPVNPLYNWHFYDARQKSLTESAAVPSQDQLRTELDVSVQYRINSNLASRIKRETGTVLDAINVHLVPKLRSVLREQGKRIRRAEDFFLEETQNKLERALESDLQDYCSSKGIDIQAVLIRDIRLPDFIMKAIEAKKEREQAVERQKAELARFTTEQEQKIAAAQAEEKAAEALAAKKKILADANAYEIKKINEAVAKNPSYIQLRALETLKSMSEDPASKIYFLDSNSPNPIPLMHIGEGTRRK